MQGNRKQVDLLLKKLSNSKIIWTKPFELGPFRIKSPSHFEKSVSKGKVLIPQGKLKFEFPFGTRIRIPQGKLKIEFPFGTRIRSHFFSR